MAFVLIQHLAPDHESLLSELVRRFTRMTVYEAAEGMVVARDSVYVIPPNRDLAIIGGSLHLLEPSAPRGQRLPIDFFLRSLALDWSDDPAAWAADTQYLCGRDFLVSPVLDDAGRAEVYLPAGVWRDFWTGERIEGPRRLPPRVYPRSRIPVYLRDGARIPYYPEPVSCTDAMASGKEAVLAADGAFAGVGSTPLGRLCGLE